jgi:hypothetical protein
VKAQGGDRNEGEADHTSCATAEHTSRRSLVWPDLVRAPLQERCPLIRPNKSQHGKIESLFNPRSESRLPPGDLIAALTWPIDVAQELKEMQDEPDIITDYASLLRAQLEYKVGSGV